jgi:iron complex outermembrane receptor protein
MRWIDESEDLLRPANIAADAKAEDMLYHDIVGTYSWQNINLSVGIDNLTDEEPPYFHSAFNANTAPQMYDTFGMRAWTRISVNF